MKSALPSVQGEPDTRTWYAIRLSKSKFGIFDTFAEEKGRQAHLDGKVAAALMQKEKDLLVNAPSIEKIDVLASYSSH